MDSFKALGVFYVVSKIINDHPGTMELCTATDGNHGKAVARAAKLRNLDCRIYMPDETTEARIKSIENEGARVIKISGNYDDACIEAAKWGERPGTLLVQDTAGEEFNIIPALIMTGYTSLFREMEDTINPVDNPVVDCIFLQAGVGSFAGAATWYYLNRYGNKRPNIVIVEPLEADGIFESFRQKERSFSRGNFKTIMAGLNCGLPSADGWRYIKHGADAAVRINDTEAKQAIRDFYFPGAEDPRIVSGESGCAGLAGLRTVMRNDEFSDLKDHLQLGINIRILLINTEGDTDRTSFNKIVSEAN